MGSDGGSGVQGRFFKLCDGLGVEVALVFRGEKAEAVARTISWPTEFTHPMLARVRDAIPLPPGRKFYLRGTLRVTPERSLLAFDLTQIDHQMRGLRLREDFAELTLQRLSMKAAAARHGEGVLWGFGRPHPTKPQFKPHPDLAGPLRDFRPGRQDGWRFKPVYIGLRPDPRDRPTWQAVQVTTAWAHDHLTVIATQDPADVPPELDLYVRPRSRTAQPQAENLIQ